MLTAWLLVMLGSAVSAGPPPPDYRVVLDEEFGRSLSVLNSAGRYREAIKRGGRIQRAIDRLPQVSYEIGYAHYQLGELDAAIRNYDAALLRDPGLTVARYDRGEVYLQVGRHAAASADFLVVAHETPNHWAGHFRLAHMAGLSGDPDRFEQHLMDALQHGFRLDSVTADPDWNRFSRHVTLRPVLRKIIVLYGDEALLKWIGDRP